ncbi:M23 family metallopeptidase [Methylobacterium cerastii]|uniref:M23 family metallopeptidase n=1 Tax=Methylobacterium cerastii TaxID=932741 RepID=UPI001EE25A1B|nr:M23 family metallopeptidase [Methylobacterium cerastii]
MAAYLLAPALAWGAAASWYAWRGAAEAEQALADGATQKAAYEDKVRALTRRLVGVASHQMLEQGGLADRMADIVTRQVELETRAATLAGYAERIADPSRGASAMEAAPARAQADEGPRETTRDASTRLDARGAPPPPNVLRIGGPAPGQPAPPPGPRSALDGVGPVRSDRIRELLALPTRDQFDALDASQARVAATQNGALAALAQGARNGGVRIRTVLAEIGVVPVMPALLPPPRLAAPRDAFAEGTRHIDAGLAETHRWRVAADSAPLRRPIDAAERNLTSNFGTRKDPFTGVATMHAGMDFRAPVGTSVVATAAGRVITASVTGGYGNLVELDHGNGVITRYGHLSAFQVSVGQSVQPNTVIGLVGSTGRSTGPHLHYETRLVGVAVDPMRFLKAGVQLYEHAPSAEARVSQAAIDETSED